MSGHKTSDLPALDRAPARPPRRYRTRKGDVNEIDLTIEAIAACGECQSALAKLNGLTAEQLAELFDCDPSLVLRQERAALAKLRRALEADVQAGRLCPEDFAPRDTESNWLCAR